MSHSAGVVLLHGLARTSRSFRKMERALQGFGFVTLNLDYASRRRPLEALVEDIHPAIAGFAESVDELHFVTHSMGGLLARAYLAGRRPRRLARVVMLGPPNNGSEVADLLRDFAPFRAFYGPAGQQVGTGQCELFAQLPLPHCPVGIIAGNRTLDPVASFFVLPRPNDGRVSVVSTKLEGMADHITLKTSHSLMLLNRNAITQTIAFLRMGRFEHSTQLPASLRARAKQSSLSEEKILDCFVASAQNCFAILSRAPRNDGGSHNGAGLLQMICPTAQAETRPMSSSGLTGRPSIPETPMFDCEASGMLDAPLSRGMTPEKTAQASPQFPYTRCGSHIVSAGT